MLLSIIIPIFNAEKFLPRCIESILNQTYNNFELILVDDGSTDKSSELCDFYACKDNRIRIIHKANSGQMQARRDGLLASQGEYIAFVDADDWLEKDMYELLMKEAINGNDLVICNFYYDYLKFKTEFHNKIYYNVKKGEKIYYIINPDKYFEFMMAGCLFNKLFKRDLILKIIKNIDSDITYGEDAAITFTYFINCKNIKLVEKCLYHYRQNSESITHKYHNELPRKTRKLIAYIEDNIMSVNKMYYQQMRLFFYFVITVAIKNESFISNSTKELKYRIIKIMDDKKISEIIKNVYIPNADLYSKLLDFSLKRQHFTVTAILIKYWRIYLKFKAKM